MQPHDVEALKKEYDREELDCDSDSSMKSCHKHVTFKVNQNGDGQNKTQEGHCKLKNKLKRLSMKKLSISREDMPDGSDVFRQALREIENEINEETRTLQNGSGQENVPLKSILKKR